MWLDFKQLFTAAVISWMHIIGSRWAGGGGVGGGGGWAVGGWLHLPLGHRQ